MANWRILNIDWYQAGLLAHESKRIVEIFYGPMIPLKIWRMIENKEYWRIVRGHTIG